MLANIRPNIRHILGISLLPLFYPYGRYLALFYLYGQDPTLAYIPHSHPSVFIARGIITGGGHDTAQPRITTPRPIILLVISTLGDSLRADPRIPEI